MERLFQGVASDGRLKLMVDLEKQDDQTLAEQEEIAFEVDPFRKHCLLHGLDDIGLTLQHVDDNSAYEEKRAPGSPWLFDIMSTL